MGPKRVVVFPFVICLEERCIIVSINVDERIVSLCYYKSRCAFFHNIMCFLQNSEFPGSQSEATGATLCRGWAELSLASGHQGAAAQRQTQEQLY